MVVAAAPPAPCPAASVCAADPSACESQLDTRNLVLLVVIVALPLLSILWLPLAGAAQQLRWGGASRGAGHAKNRVSDAMGVPNGLLIVLASLALGFLPTFFLLLASPHACSTALGGCGSISCACGNYIPQGYTWMAVTLSLGALGVMREAAVLDGRARACTALGGTCVLFTAIFPEEFTIDPLAPGHTMYIGYLMHVGGLGCAVLLLVVSPYVQVVAATRRMSARARLRALLPRSLHVAALLGYAVAFLLLRPDGPDISDYCAPLAPALFEAAQPGISVQDARRRAAEACAAWPALPPADCTALAPPTGVQSARGSPLPARYTCTWLNSSLTPAEALLYPPEYVARHDGACVKFACRLLVNARSIALEFGMLFLVASFVTSYLRVDLAWVNGVAGAAGDGGAPAPHVALRRDEPAEGLLAPAAYAAPWAMPSGSEQRALDALGRAPQQHCVPSRCSIG